MLNEEGIREGRKTKLFTLYTHKHIHNKIRKKYSGQLESSFL